MVNLKARICGTILGAAATVGIVTAGVLEINRRDAERKARDNLPTEVIHTAKYQNMFDMYLDVTRGLSGKDKPTFDEFCDTAAKMNGTDYETLRNRFNGPSVQLTVPNYDGAVND